MRNRWIVGELPPDQKRNGPCFPGDEPSRAVRSLERVPRLGSRRRGRELAETARVVERATGLPVPAARPGEQHDRRCQRGSTPAASVWPDAISVRGKPRGRIQETAAESWPSESARHHAPWPRPARDEKVSAVDEEAHDELQRMSSARFRRRRQRASSIHA